MKRNVKKPNFNSNRRGARPKESGKFESNYKCKPEGKEDTSTNDPRWYATNPSLLRDAASYPFSWVAGAKINYDPLWLQSTPVKQLCQNLDMNTTVPGLCTLQLRPSFGMAKSADDAINVAAKNIYMWVRHANSGHANYDAPDLGIYLLAVTQVYAYINFLQRIYGCANLFDQRNRNMPRILCTAQYADFEDISENLANFRFGINLLISKAASLTVPGDFPIFARYAFLYSSLYTEGTSIKDQMYMYTPECFYEFALDEDGAGQLVEVPYADFNGGNPRLKTVKELLDYGNSMISKLLEEEDFGIMGGDIRKAYSNLLTLQMMPLEYVIAPVFNIGVLEQMKNAIALGQVYYGTVNQDPTHSFLTSTAYVGPYLPNDNAPMWQWNARRLLIMDLHREYILTTTTSETNPELVIESSRLMAMPLDWDNVVTVGTDRTYINHEGNSIEVKEFDVHEVTCGSEVCTHFYIWTNNAGSFSVRQHDSQNLIFDEGNTPHVLLLEAYAKASESSSFRFHPRERFVLAYQTPDSDSFKWYQLGELFDIDNYTLLNNHDIHNLHQTALMSLLNVPGRG